MFNGTVAILNPVGIHESNKVGSAPKGSGTSYSLEALGAGYSSYLALSGCYCGQE
jgi:hypothetical protein